MKLGNSEEDWHCILLIDPPKKKKKENDRELRIKNYK